METVGKYYFKYYRVPEGTTDKKGKPSSAILFERDKDGKAPFAASPRGGITVAFYIMPDGSKISAAAICSMSDNFCYKTGKLISAGRLNKILNG